MQVTAFLGIVVINVVFVVDAIDPSLDASIRKLGLEKSSIFWVDSN